MGKSARWTPAEDELLQGLCGDMPWPMVVQSFNSWAKKMGHPTRTGLALVRRCENTGTLRRTVGAWITTGVICELMKISHSTVRRWLVIKNYLPYHRYGTSPQHRFYVRRRDLRRLALDKPRLFGGMSVCDLTQLLDSQRLAEQIVDLNLGSPRGPVPVVCVETGRRFSSIREAAHNAFVTPARLRAVLDHPTHTAGNLHWRRAL